MQVKEQTMSHRLEAKPILRRSARARLVRSEPWRALLPALLLQITLGIMLEASAVQAASARWTMPGELGCILRTCLEYYPQGGGPPIRQGVFSQQIPPGRGELRVPPGEYTLRRQIGHTEQALRLTGPMSLALSDREAFQITPGALRYEHPLDHSLTSDNFAKDKSASDNRASDNRASDNSASDAREFRILLPAMVAGPEGTVIEALFTRSGDCFIRVLEGRALIHPMLDRAGPGLLLVAGEATVVTEDNDAQPLLRLTGKEADLQKLGLEARDAGLRSAPAATPEGAFAGYLEKSVRVDAAGMARLALELALLYPQAEVAPRALYLAWLRAETEGASGVGVRLAGELERSYPQSRWWRLLLARKAG